MGPSDAHVTVHWIERGQDASDADRALAEWARARGVVLETEGEGAKSAMKVDFTVADRVEQELVHARDAIDGQDVDAAERALARADALLRAHPELPQAAWLRAEVERGWSARYARVEPKDLDRSVAAWQRADGLAGPREPGVGDIALPASAPLVKENFVWEGDTDGQVLVDGTPVKPGPIERTASEHQVLVLDRGETVWAGWVAFADGDTLRLGSHATDACAATDLSRATVGDGEVRAPGVACAHWIAVVAGERRGEVKIARCDRDNCDSFLEWRVRGHELEVPQIVPHTRPWPAWATWVLVGAGAVTIASVTVVATGALEPRPVETRFVNGGVQVSRYRR